MLNRRDLLTGFGPLAAAGWLGLSALVAEAQEKEMGEALPYVLPPLLYAYEALEPVIDAATMKLQHDLHHAGYVKGLNAALDKLAEARKSGDYAAVKALSREVAFHGSAHLLHCVFWTNMTPAKTEPQGMLKRMLERDFGSTDAFKAQFGNAAKQVEASGWGILGCLLGQTDFQTAGQTFQAAVEPQQALELQTAAIRALTRTGGAEGGAILVTRDRWNGYSPAIRDVVLSGLLGNPSLVNVLLSAVESGNVPAETISAERRNQLLHHREGAIRQRAEVLFKDLIPGDRMKAYEAAKPVLALPAMARTATTCFKRTVFFVTRLPARGRWWGRT